MQKGNKEELFINESREDNKSKKQTKILTVTIIAFLTVFNIC